MGVCVSVCIIRSVVTNFFWLWPPGSSVREILQARMLEWAAMPSSSFSWWDWGDLSSVTSLGRKTTEGKCSAHHVKETLYPRALSQMTRKPWSLAGGCDRLLHHEVTPSAPRLLHPALMGEVTAHARGREGLHSHPWGRSISVSHLTSTGGLSPLERLNHSLTVV